MILFAWDKKEIKKYRNIGFFMPLARTPVISIMG